MINWLIYFLVVVVILGLIYYVVTQVPLPHPFGQVARIVVLVVGVLVIVLMLLGLIGYAPVMPLR